MRNIMTSDYPYYYYYHRRIYRGTLALRSAQVNFNGRNEKKQKEKINKYRNMRLIFIINRLCFSFGYLRGNYTFYRLRCGRVEINSNCSPRSPVHGLRTYLPTCCRGPMCV